MVSLRSGRRTNRESPKSKSTKETNATPKRKIDKKVNNMFVSSKEPEVIEIHEATPVKIDKPTRSSNTESNAMVEKSPKASRDSEKIVKEQEEKIMEPEIIEIEPELEKETEQKSEESGNADVVLEEKHEEEVEKSEGEDLEDEEESDDDMPEEVTSKKPQEIPVENDIETEAAPEPEISQYEKVVRKKAKMAQKDQNRKEKKRKNRKRMARKLEDGVYEVKEKKSRTSFQVVTQKGMKNILEPEISFREELLRNRTANCRVSDVRQTQHRAKWVGK